MTNVPLTFIRRYLNTQSMGWLFIALSLTLIGANMIDLALKTRAMKIKREKTPYIFVGIKYSGLDQFLAKERAAGYATDRSLDDTLGAAHFAQAQYMLAPVILTLNQDQTEYIIFDFSNEALAFRRMKELGYRPFKRNQFGVILARKSGGSP